METHSGDARKVLPGQVRVADQQELQTVLDLPAREVNDHQRPAGALVGNTDAERCQQEDIINCLYAAITFRQSGADHAGSV